MTPTPQHAHPDPAEQPAPQLRALKRPVSGGGNTVWVHAGPHCGISRELPWLPCDRCAGIGPDCVCTHIDEDAWTEALDNARQHREVQPGMRTIRAEIRAATARHAA